MRGKRMRCPNPICRAVIDVQDDTDKPPVAPPAPVKEAPPPPVELAPIEAPAPEPVKRRPIPRPIAPLPEPDFPDDFPGDDEAAPAPTGPALATEAWQPEAWEAPPARAEAMPTPAPTLTLPEPAPRKRRRALWAMAGMVLVLGLVAGGSYWRIRGGIETNEIERFQKAEELYRNKDFADASPALQTLHRDFPDSPHNKKYRFLAELSDVRQAAYGSREKPEEAKQALERVLQFATVYKGDALLKEREADLWETLHRLSNELTTLAELEKAPGFVVLAKRAWSEAKKYSPPATADASERQRKLTEEWSRIDTMLAVHLERLRIVAALKKNLERPTVAGIQESRALVDKAKFHEDAEIRGLLEAMVKAHREQVVFTPADPTEKRALLEEDALASLSVTPSLKADRSAATSSAPVLALARGVLYALEPAKGEIRWVKRVGIDARSAPLRVPADLLTPELALVVSSDQRSISALVMETGLPLWQTPLSEVCVGTPVLVDRHLLAPTLSGRIDEIEIAEGRRFGSYDVGQPLTLGGIHQPGTSLVYFPADEYCLYVIDITKRSCTNILYTRHPAGSLRGLPVIVAREKRSLLLWSQATGLHQAEVKPYALPIERSEQKPVEPILRLPGLSDAPWHDGHRLGIVNETGMLSLWDFGQKLFPLLKQDFAIEASKQPGHCVVVHADADNLWTLTRGRLQRVETTFQPTTGPGVRVRWTQPIVLGTLLHPVEARRDANGHTILFLTTQADDAPVCLCTAVDADEGKVLWQRQLGVIPHEEPLLFGDHLLVRDAHGLLRFQPSSANAKAWQPAGKWVSRRAQTHVAHQLLANDALFVQLTWLPGGTKLHVQFAPVNADQKLASFDIALPATLQGTPALGDGFLLLPLANGIVVRLGLADHALNNGPDWRAVGAEEQTRGHVAVVSATDFVVTDGSRGLTRCAWLDARTWEKRESAQLSHRIVGPPVLIPGEKDTAPKLCVADASDTLTLLDGEKLSLLKRWPMPGRISAGPFVRAGKIGCVVGKNRLVWLDPVKDEPAWQYTFADIVGEPHLIDGVLVVADVAGQVLALDPGSGRSVGPGLTFKANVAATAAPMPFGPGQAFVPLTDGTVIVLPLAKLR
jgi:hypothetical protein